MGNRAMQRVYPRSEQQKASPWRLIMLPVRGWGPAIEHYQRAISSPSALEGHCCAERYNSEEKITLSACLMQYILRAVSQIRMK